MTIYFFGFIAIAIISYLLFFHVTSEKGDFRYSFMAPISFIVVMSIGFDFNKSFVNDLGAPLLDGVTGVESTIYFWILIIISFALIPFLIYFYKKGWDKLALVIASVTLLTSSAYSGYLFTNMLVFA